MELLKPSLNISNQFQSIHLNDPINISVNNTLYSKSTTKDIPVRFSHKERIPKERDYIGSYKIPGEYLKKRTNPTEELIKKKEEELRKKKELLELYENTGERFIRKTYTETTDLNGQNEQGKQKQKQEFNIHEISDVEDYEQNKNEDEGIAVKEDLIKVIDSQVSLLKRMSQDQINKLSKSGSFKNRKNLFIQNGAFGLEEKDVDTHFLAINENRTQTFKHVHTRHKPEYMPLEELEKAKSEHEKELMDIEDEYYGRKKISEEELRRQREERKKMLRQRQLNQMIQRPGYNNDNPLEEKDILYINKYENYLRNKKDEYNKLGYEEEWNNTRLKSLNANGLVNRTDGLPGDLDIDDYKLYYYDIGDNTKLNFERPLLIHPHTGKESAYKKTFRNEPGYENTTGKMYKTQTDEDSTYYITNKNNLRNPKNLSINTNNYNNFNRNYNIRKNYEEDNNEQNFQTEINNAKNKSFIKMIFKLLPKNAKGKTLKNRIALEMKLDENTITELGFKDEEDFQNKLIKFPTKELTYMSEEEFVTFLLNKGIDPNENNIQENQLYSLTGQNFYRPEDNLPGMSTTTFDFLKNPSTKARLRHVNKVLGGKKSKSSSNFFGKNKKNLRIDEQDYIYYKDRHKYKLNNSYEHGHTTGNTNNINNTNNTNYMYNTYTNYNTSNNINYNLTEKYNKKSDINFTVPEPFDFLKKNYHEKKLTKIQEILEERQKNESEIFNHRFKANDLDRKMFTTGNVQSRLEREKKRRAERIKLKNKEIKANLQPFSFYDKDEQKYKEKLQQVCVPPKFLPFKANPIKWRSQVKVAQGLVDNELARKERNQRRAQELLAKSSLPPRMEMHEKHKKLRQEEEKKIERQNIKKERSKRVFHAKQSPNFKVLHERFINSLENKKRLAKPTVPEPFTFHQPKKKAELCDYLDFENNPKNKNPKKNKSLQQIKKKMQKKPDIEPATTKGLMLLMATRREEIEARKKKEEDIIKENEQRKKRHQEFNERVRNSEVMIKNKKWKKEMEEKIIETLENKKMEIKRNDEEYKNTIRIVNQKINNRPLMMESVVRKDEVNAMNEE